MIQEMWQGYVIVIMTNQWTAIMMRDFQGYKWSLMIIDRDQASMIFEINMVSIMVYDKDMSSMMIYNMDIISIIVYDMEMISMMVYDIDMISIMMIYDMIYDVIRYGYDSYDLQHGYDF